MTIAVIAWSLAAMAHALASGFWSFFVARACPGLTEGPNLPAAFKAIAEWFPRGERSMATGMVTAGTGLGLILAPPVAGLLTDAYSWHAAFLVPGISGLVWVGFWNRHFTPARTPPDDFSGRTQPRHQRQDWRGVAGGVAAFETDAVGALPALSRNLRVDPRAIRR